MGGADATTGRKWQEWEISPSRKAEGTRSWTGQTIDGRFDFEKLNTAGGNKEITSRKRYIKRGCRGFRRRKFQKIW